MTLKWLPKPINFFSIDYLKLFIILLLFKVFELQNFSKRVVNWRIGSPAANRAKFHSYICSQILTIIIAIVKLFFIFLNCFPYILSG